METRNGVETFRYDQGDRLPILLAFLSESRVLLTQGGLESEAFVHSFLQSAANPTPFEEKFQQHLTAVGGASAFLVARVASIPRSKSAFGNLLDQLQELRGNIDWLTVGDRKSTRLNSSHIQKSRMPSSA